MGFFKKFKKENIDSVEDKNIEFNDVIEDNQKIALENELSQLEKKIKEKNERLNVIIEKIGLSKKEYDEIIGKIIQTKKELQLQENSELDTAKLTKTMNQDMEKISEEINDSKMRLKGIQEEIKNNSEINDKLEQKIKKNEPVFSDTEVQKKQIDEELDQRKKELEILNKRLIKMKDTSIKNNTGDDSKSVVEAASQIVATTNKRLHDTMKELDVIRQLLDKERKAHNETKKKL